MDSGRAESLGYGWHSADWAQRLKEPAFDADEVIFPQSAGPGVSSDHVEGHDIDNISPFSLLTVSVIAYIASNLCTVRIQSLRGTGRFAEATSFGTEEVR